MLPVKVTYESGQEVYFSPSTISVIPMLNTIETLSDKTMKPLALLYITMDSGLSVVAKKVEIGDMLKFAPQIQEQQKNLEAQKNPVSPDRRIERVGDK